jgi:hypothetical protein
VQSYTIYRLGAPFVKDVAGGDCGALNVGVSLFDEQKGRPGPEVMDYSLHRSALDPNLATQSHAAQMNALEGAMCNALEASQISGDAVKAFADSLCPPYTTYSPEEREAAEYKKLYSLHCKPYFSLGLPNAAVAHLRHVISSSQEIVSKAKSPELK